MPRLRAAFYGDDFTGSVDALLQFARRGWSGRLFVGLPDARALEHAAAESDVVGIAGIARSLRTGELDAEVRPVLEALASLHPRFLQYKACSTADSSPTIGSIGRIIELGREVVGEHTVPLVFAQPDFGRYTLHGVHFAAEGGIVYRLDRQPTMSTHPSTPMTEPDLAIHFSHQTDLPIGSIPFTAYGHDLAEQIRRSDAAAVVLDAAIDEHLEAVGRAIAHLEAPVFAIGSGGLSLAIAASEGAAASPLPTHSATPGPVLAVSGSRSSQTRRQMDAAAAADWFVQPLELEGSRAAAQLDWVLSALRAGRSVALSSDDADTAAADRPVLEAIADAAATVAAGAAAAGATRRLIVCGGDTSSRVIRLLGVESLSIAANPWGNIVLLSAHAADPAIDGLELLLKGGQVGSADLFERVRALGD
ncbi:MAG: four-carbon acid sugar kinase family protein [Microbacterium sp.]